MWRPPGWGSGGRPAPALGLPYLWCGQLWCGAVGAALDVEVDVVLEFVPVLVLFGDEPWPLAASAAPPPDATAMTAAAIASVLRLSIATSFLRLHCPYNQRPLGGP